MNMLQVHDMMDDIAEAMDLNKEISEAISNPVGFHDDIDEDELEEEFQEMFAELSVVATPSESEVDHLSTALPRVPQHEPSSKKSSHGTKARDRELEDLENWVASW